MGFHWAGGACKLPSQYNNAAWTTSPRTALYLALRQNPEQRKEILSVHHSNTEHDFNPVKLGDRKIGPGHKEHLEIIRGKTKKKQCHCTLFPP